MMMIANLARIRPRCKDEVKERNLVIALHANKFFCSNLRGVDLTV